MSTAKYKQTQQELNDLKEQIVNLQKLLQKQCPHNDIEETWYVNDDYAYRKEYTCYYKCKCCGLIAYYDESEKKEKSKEFLKLAKIHQRNEKKKRSKM